MENVLADRINMGVFGDSIGKGIVLPKGSGRYEVLKNGISEFFEKYNVSIDNFSMMGCTVSKGLSIVKRRATELSRYKNVFLEFGGNDCDYFWNEIAEKPDMDHAPKTPVNEFVEKYKLIIEEIRKNGGRPIILTLPPLDAERYFNWITKKLNRESILKWIGSVDTIYRWQELYNLQSVMIASKLSVPLIDIRSAFLTNHHYADLLCEDGIHPNKDGYELIYQTIAAQFESGLFA